MKCWYAHGKVLLCGEYAVMAGLESLALPVVYGQWLKLWEVKTDSNASIVWQSIDKEGKEWFSCKLDPIDMHIVDCTDVAIAEKLIQLLQFVKTIKPTFFNQSNIRIETECEFDRTWGLGTSSTLVILISQWTGVDAFALQNAVFNGSGYDVAVGQTGKPIAYWLDPNGPNWEPWNLPSTITENWYLAFPGKKVNSKNALINTSHKITTLKDDIFLWKQLNMCISAIKNPVSVAMTEAMLEMWQALLSSALELPRTYDDLGIEPIKGGLCKWLGAWGGDIILINQKTLQQNESIFSEMEIVPWADLIAE